MVLRSRGVVRRCQVQQWLEAGAQAVRDILYKRKVCSSPGVYVQPIRERLPISSQVMRGEMEMLSADLPLLRLRRRTMISRG